MVSAKRCYLKCTIRALVNGHSNFVSFAAHPPHIEHNVRTLPTKSDAFQPQESSAPGTELAGRDLQHG